jgi:hypothetical protein
MLKKKYNNTLRARANATPRANASPKSPDDYNAYIARAEKEMAGKVNKSPDALNEYISRLEKEMLGNIE